MTHAMPCGADTVPDTEEARRLEDARPSWESARGWLARLWLENRHAK